MKINHPYRKSPWRFLFAGTALLSGGWLIFCGALQCLKNYLPLSLSPGEASTIGIIGGADGPTAIFVTGVTSTGPDWDLILMAAILILSVLAFFRLRRCKPKES